MLSGSVALTFTDEQWAAAMPKANSVIPYHRDRRDMLKEDDVEWAEQMSDAAGYAEQAWKPAL